ncbi:MAG: hypothetical protein MRJ92_07425 [Nitrospira sp.]|nr:hypothetical protein [Nitrospira sp.]
MPSPGSARIHPKAIRAAESPIAGCRLPDLDLLVGYLAYWWSYDRFVRTDNAYVTGNLVPVAAQASGIVTQVLAEETCSRIGAI